MRTLARPLLAGIFLVGGYGTFRDPGPRVRIAGPVLDAVAPLLPPPLRDREQLVRANAAAQMTAGACLAAGVAPRLSALFLAASMVPTTLGGHRFWEHDDAGQREQQRTQFLKNAAILGGLLAAAA
jgi:uncharacterized membrane protein YphA (DoxX/SURF4 family)